MNRLRVFLPGLILLAACTSTRHARTMNITRCTYSDGNANLYEITETRLHYTGVKPEESSSGMYSGGPDRDVTYGPETWTRIRTAVIAAIQDTAAHTPTRHMGTGQLQWEENGQRVEVILKMGAPVKDALETVLRGIQ